MPGLGESTSAHVARTGAGMSAAVRHIFIRYSFISFKRYSHSPRDWVAGHSLWLKAIKSWTVHEDHSFICTFKYYYGLIIILGHQLRISDSEAWWRPHLVSFILQFLIESRFLTCTVDKSQMYMHWAIICHWMPSEELALSSWEVSIWDILGKSNTSQFCFTRKTLYKKDTVIGAPLPKYYCDGFNWSTCTRPISFSQRCNLKEYTVSRIRAKPTQIQTNTNYNLESLLASHWHLPD